MIKFNITPQYLSLFVLVLALMGCSKPGETNENQKVTHPIVGTWKLLSSQTIKAEDTIFTDFTKGQEMIKIINDSHFAFLRHDLNKGQDSSAIYVAGGGTYTIDENKYTENLQYLNFREWEGNTFHFDIDIENDSLTQTGVERIEDLNIDQIIIEKYVRMK